MRARERKRDGSRSSAASPTVPASSAPRVRRAWRARCSSPKKRRDWVQTSPKSRAIAPSRSVSLPARQATVSCAHNSRRPLTLLTVITALVLVVACTNFTNLMFARAEARRREFLIRLAVGAGRWRLIRQSAAECLALAAIAGVLALLFAGWATSMAMSLVSALEPLEPLDFAIELNTRVMAFAGACVFAAALFGLWPCMRLVRSTVISSVHHRTAAAGARPVANRIMLIGQLVVCAILMFGAGLLLRTVINLRTQDLGYERDVLLIPIEAERPGRPPDAASALVEDLRQRIATIPGVQAAGVFGSALLDYGAYWVDGSERLRTDRGEAAAGTKWTFAFAGPGFFDAVGMRAVQGRPLSEAGHAGEVAINESLARALFGNADPIGRQLAMNPKEPMLTIVGVMKDARQISPRDRGIGVAYLPIRRYGRVTLAVRLASPSLAQAASVRQQAQTILGDVQAGPMTTISQELERSIARERLTSGIALFLAVLVVAIGCVGIYALMNYDVTRRQREFGVRLALGASAGRLVATVLRDGAAIVAPALAIGLPAGLATSRLLASQLYGVDARDPWTLSSVAVLLSVVAMGVGVQACAARVAHRSDGAAAARVSFASPTTPANATSPAGCSSRNFAHSRHTSKVVQPSEPFTNTGSNSQKLGSPLTSSKASSGANT